MAAILAEGARQRGSRSDVDWRPMLVPRPPQHVIDVCDVAASAYPHHGRIKLAKAHEISAFSSELLALSVMTRRTVMPWLANQVWARCQKAAAVSLRS
ncbi:hypothetical protein, partial [Micromonospora echinaurantiaca]|uniref:hypothetical protein n=1 Tax=Micromonospora echinaurantiaca TaxID=47857 RepID=UPI0037A2B5BB